MLSRFFIFLMAIMFNQVFGQQWVQFTQDFRYDMYLNPAMSGANSSIHASASHRSQYVGLSNKAISTQQLGFATPLFSEKFGVGLNVVNDQIGFQRYTLGNISLAYHQKIKSGSLSYGLSGGFVQLGLDGLLLRASDGNYASGTVVHNDQYLPDFRVGGMSPTLSAGLAYNNSRFTIGAGLQNLISPKISFESANSGTFTQINRTINAHSSYVIAINKIKLIPGVQYKTDLIKHQLQTNFLIDVKNIFLGMAFRGYSGYNNDALAGIFGFKIKNNFSIGYSYDYNVSGLNNSNSGSHEISIRYEKLIKFNEKSLGNIMHNPRFL